MYMIVFLSAMYSLLVYLLLCYHLMLATSSVSGKESRRYVIQTNDQFKDRKNQTTNTKILTYCLRYIEIVF